METPEICEYPDSGKFMADSKTGDGRVFRVMQRTANDLDYWDGEP
jgi:uncharacterized cupin superfamily protein